MVIADAASKVARTGQLIVTMGSHPTCREGMCVGTKWNRPFRYHARHDRTEIKTIPLPMDWQTFGGTSNPEALERAYFDEINCFVDCIQGKAQWAASRIIASQCNRHSNAGSV